MSPVQQEETKMPSKQAKTSNTRNILSFGLYLSISMSLYDNILQNYIIKLHPVPPSPQYFSPCSSYSVRNIHIETIF